MIPPKVQQVLDEMKGCWYYIGDARFRRWVDSLQSALEEMQQERQALIDAATERAAKFCEVNARVLRKDTHKAVPSWDIAERANESVRLAVMIRTLIGQPLNEAKGG